MVMDNNENEKDESFFDKIIDSVEEIYDDLVNGDEEEIEEDDADEDDSEDDSEEDLEEEDDFGTAEILAKMEHKFEDDEIEEDSVDVVHEDESEDDHH